MRSWLLLGALLAACASTPAPQQPAVPREIVIEFAIVPPHWVEQFVRTDGEDYRAFAADPQSAGQIAEIRHILIRGDDRKRAEAVLERLKKGEDFAEVAKSVSEDGSKMRGGSLGTDSTKFVEPFRIAADALKPGEMSGLVQTQFGFHIIKKDPVTPETSAAAWRKMKSAEVSKKLAAKILEQRAKSNAMDEAITVSISSMLGDVAAHDAERPVARTFDLGLEQDALAACHDRKEHFRRLFARSKAEPPLQKTLLCVELSELAKFARAPAPGATFTLGGLSPPDAPAGRNPHPLPKHDTDPLVAFAAAH
jgi:hypothetical protein